MGRVSRPLREAIRGALIRQDRGSSDRTMQYEVAAIRADCPWATRKQAWLVYAREQGIEIRKYEDDKEELKEVDEILKRRASSAQAIESLSPPRRKPTIAGVSEPLPRESFEFVSHPQIRSICKRDYQELQKVRRRRANKSIIVLCGGLLEGMLWDALSGRDSEAKASYKKLYPGKKRPSIGNWGLERLIQVAEDLKIITAGATRLSDTLRGYRNVVHPAKEIRSGYKVENDEAAIAVHMVNIVMRDLKAR